MIKAVLFDLDGTLLNRDASVRRFIDLQYDRFEHLLDSITKKEYIERFLQLDNRGYVWKDKVYQQMIKEFEIIGISWEELLQDYISEFKYSCIPFPHLIEMLEELKTRNIAIGMITNGRGQFQMDNIQALGIEKYFDSILVSEWEGMKKPNPNIFLKALQDLEVNPEESLFIGDHPENDVIAATAVGMKGVWKKDKHWKHATTEYTIDDLLEILHFL
ncbi:HAD family hydrolase [Gracilibacillus dipsosauri]|uniref:L-2-haloalkanoic acid dehalogenase n=1 Tax=Gracilibacillus dipsosauri TaxID=178340 RepID=A0A317L0G7_9BACI|nr:HAD family hydrolase [Gracilibacillus dipsosauri]PWU68744.1 L-2-haloalkanoic acid dehalogenase [Gracilibacillus dipsosauri]